MASAQGRGGTVSAAVTRNKPPPNEFSGFGFPETPTLVEACRRDNCDRNKPLVTDLYCRSHGRFLPLIASPVSVRASVVITMSVIIYGFFELAEQIDSPVPVFLVYAAICLGFVFFPLRHFARTATIASLIWVIASIASIISRATGTHFRLVTAATALVIGITVFTLYAIAEAADTDAHVSRRRELRTLAIKVAIALIVATGMSCNKSGAAPRECYPARK